MKMQKYIRVILSFILVLSNLSVAFSMHLCQGNIEEIKFSQHQKKDCKQHEKPSCCAKEETNNRCDTHHTKHKENDDCCKDLAYLDDLQDQQTVEIFRFSPILFEVKTIDFIIDPFVDELVSLQLNFLDSYIESNAPPIYILNNQLVLYEA